MSSKSSSPSSGTDPVPWDELSSPERQQLLLAIGSVNGPGVFERPDLKKAVAKSTTVEDVVDSRDKVVKSLKSTRLLNGLVEDGYLQKTFQGGKNPIVLDLEYDEDRDTWEVAPFGVASKLQTIAFDVLDREGLGKSELGGIDLTDFNAVVSAVNRAVGRTVLVIVSDPSKYRLRGPVVPTVMKKVEKATASD